MSGKFSRIPFSSCNLSDSFFDSLKADYPEFSDWFLRKSRSGEVAYVFQNERSAILAFMYLKKETEAIQLCSKIRPSRTRLKIGTLKLSDSIQGQRLGEGALGNALWRWQQSSANEIYLTIFPHHTVLMDLVTKFGFANIGKNERGEYIFLKDKSKLQLEDPFKSFPYLLPNFSKAGYLPVYDDYHDKLFPYSELYRTNQETEEVVAANGITKIFLAFPPSALHHKVGEPVIIYRIYTGATGKTYKSVATSYCTLTRIVPIISHRSKQVSQDDFLNLTRNKTVFSQQELQDLYRQKANLTLIEMVYNGFFGKGHNVNHKALSEAGLFSGHPYNIELTPNEFLTILQMGDKNVSDLIAN
ncbi:MAG: hypothetical protein ABFD79_11775 [Phycisphaerales bacterium]